MRKGPLRFDTTILGFRASNGEEPIVRYDRKAVDHRKGPGHQDSYCSGASEIVGNLPEAPVLYF